MPNLLLHSNVGVLLVGHGTRDRSGTEEFFSLGRCLSAVLGDQATVAPCLLEFQEPTIDQAWATLIARNCDHVVVAPLLLFAAGHAKSDIPGEVAKAQNTLSGSKSVEVSFAPPISRQAAMIDAVRQRLVESLETVQPDRIEPSAVSKPATETDGATAIVMVGRGSRDVCATADMLVLSEIAVMGGPDGQPSLANRYGIAREGLHTTFYAMAQPRLPETLDCVAASGRFRRIVVHPHLLFSGRLYDAIGKQVEESARKYPHLRFHTSDYLGPTDLIARAMAARIVEVGNVPATSVG